MINLLPPQQKEELILERIYKLFLIYGVLFVIFLIALSLVFFAVKIYISGIVQGEKIIEPAQLQDEERKIIEVNDNLQRLTSFYENYPDFAGLLEKTSQIIPSGIRLNSITLNPPKEKGFFLISLQGLSPTREILLQLKKDMESDKAFKGIDFPPSNWVKPEEIEFIASFKIGS